MIFFPYNADTFTTFYLQIQAKRQLLNIETLKQPVCQNYEQFCIVNCNVQSLLSCQRVTPVASLF